MVFVRKSKSNEDLLKSLTISSAFLTANTNQAEGANHHSSNLLLMRSE